MTLEGKNVVITGATSGIGLSLLEKLKNKKDTRIIAVGRNFEKLKPYENVEQYKCDVSVKEEVDGLFEHLKEKYTTIDIFYANAGFAYYEKIGKSDWEHIENIFKTNVISPIYSLEKMIELNKGKKFIHLITASAISYMQMPGFTLYGSTKAAVHAFANGFRFEIPKNVVLSLVYPVATRTNFFNFAGGRDTPVPPFDQDVSAVTDSIIHGITKEYRHIYPSKYFFVGLILNRFLPFIFPMLCIQSAIPSLSPISSLILMELWKN